MAAPDTQAAEGPPRAPPEQHSFPCSLPKPEDLIAKAIAPINPQYLLPSPPLRRHTQPKQSNTRPEHGPSANDGEAGTTTVVKEKKSKRQLKRERLQEKKSVRNLCPEIARTGDISACKYGTGCRFAHDLGGFLEQKPEDLPGTCPFRSMGDPCPYGVACRFFRTHDVASSDGSADSLRKTRCEVNGLNKDVQKLLWKNKMEYPKADSQLKLLGCMILGNKNVKKCEAKESVDLNPGNADRSGIDGENDGFRLVCESCPDVECSPAALLTEDQLEGTSEVGETRPVKKVKFPADEEGSADEAENSGAYVEANNDVSVGNGNIKGILHDEPVAARVEILPVENLRERKLIDFRGKLYLAPLTTVGNLPFRRICKSMGADITCGEMAVCTNLLQGQASEWALLRRHSSEDFFGVQVCGAYPDTVARTVELVGRECSVDFIDINIGCPIDVIVNKGAGSALLTKSTRMKNIIQAASRTIDKPLTVKVRTGFFEGRNLIGPLLEDIGKWGATAVTIHGRSRQQRYSKLADWDYIYKCVGQAPDSMQILGNGDIFSFVDWNKHRSGCPKLSTCMIARGALIKPWIFTEIKEQRHWDITSGERLEILKKYVNFGLEHWGSDSKGVETTRHFLLEWLSYTCRYIPVGILDVIPQRLNWRPPSYFGRDSLETLMASDSATDWIKISEMLLGKVPDGFTFAPKHKLNAYDRAENG